MAITEVYMGPGDFRVSMGIETPQLMGDIVPGGYLVVTPQHLGDPRQYTNDALLGAARYTGIILETIWRNGVLTMEGASLEWILGDLDGIGWPCPSVSYSGSAITAVIALTTGGGIIPAASFSIGATITGPNYTGSHGISETIKEVLMQVVEQTETHYKISPNGEINIEAITAGNIYKDDPEIVFMRTNWGADGLWIGLPVTDLTSKYSMREWLYSSNVDYYGLNNDTLRRSDTTSQLTTRLIFGAEYKMQEIRLPFTQLSASGAAVGDNVYIWDPGSGFKGGTGDIIQFRGQYLQPEQHRIHEVSWPITDGMGVYYRPGKGSTVGSDEWIDLSHTVATSPASEPNTYVRALAARYEEQGT
jgi:hypothetical protein